ncbi:MAG TPA: HEAT repeat domain-containing protein [Candidatus Latescibacteria bacterium]|nr:HEAT repeat domain-containing protein [Candidatus Latescibacterota bacterium]
MPTLIGRAAGCLLFAGLALGCGEQHAEAYVAALNNPDRQVRLDASLSLIRLGDAAVLPLMQHARSGSDSLRYIAAQILGRIGDRRAAPFLQELINDPNQYVRERAVRALGQLGDPGQRGHLEGVLLGDRAAAVRDAAAWGLGALRDTAANAALIRAQRDSAAVVRQTALSALQFLWTPAAEEAALAALRDPDESVRYVAVQLLGFHRVGSAVDVLGLALVDSSVGVRAESARALGLIGDTTAVRALERLFTEHRGPDQDAARQALEQLTGLNYAIAP